MIYRRMPSRDNLNNFILVGCIVNFVEEIPNFLPLGVFTDRGHRDSPNPEAEANPDGQGR